MLKKSWIKIGIIIFFICLCLYIYFCVNTTLDMPNMDVNKKKIITQSIDSQKVLNEKQLDKSNKKIIFVKKNIAERKQEINEVEIAEITENQDYDEKIHNDLITGLVNEENLYYRSEHYSKLDYEIAKRQMDEANDPVENIVEQFETTIDYSLGTDFPDDKRIIMRDAQRDMLYKKELLDENQIINEQEYNENIVSYHNEYLKQIAEILSDEEFRALFQISKEEIKGALLLVIDGSSNEPIPDDIGSKE